MDNYCKECCAFWESRQGNIQKYTTLSQGLQCFANGYFPNRKAIIIVLCEGQAQPWVNGNLATWLIFQCDDGSYISKAFQCDAVQDCEANEDEPRHNCIKYVEPHEVSNQVKQPKPEYFMRKCVQPFCWPDKTRHGECSPLYFACPTGGCVPINSLCDGIQNCNDASDELLCYEENIKRGGRFGFLQKHKKIYNR